MAFTAGQKLRASDLNDAFTSIIGGQRLASDGTASSGSTVKLACTTGALSLPADSLFTVDLMLSLAVSAASQDFALQIRDGGVGGTLLMQTVLPRSQNEYPYSMRLSYAYTTTTAATKTFSGTFYRVVGAGSAYAYAGSYIAVTRLGPASLMST